MRKSLEERQAAMRSRQDARPRYGRKPKRRSKGPSERYRLQRRIFTRIRLLQGWTPQQVADFLNALHPQWVVYPNAIQRWVNKGMPLVDAKPKKKKSDAGKGPHHYQWNR
ncbi:MAG TPA: hypothetical protein VGR71_05685 [Nitrospira sp.]|nr:hypothetical protein [Nitrospira sp.]